MENDKELKQAKKRTEKIYITDIAIQKVPYIRYKNFPAVRLEYETRRDFKG